MSIGTSEGQGNTLSPSMAMVGLNDSVAEERSYTAAVTSHRDPHPDDMEMVSFLDGREQVNHTHTYDEADRANYRAFSCSPYRLRRHQEMVEQTQNSEDNLVSITIRVEQYDDNEDTGTTSPSHFQEDAGDPLTQTLTQDSRESLNTHQEQRQRQRQREPVEVVAAKRWGGEREGEDDTATTVDVEGQTSSLL